MRRFFTPPVFPRPAFQAGDALILFGIVVVLYVGLRLGFAAPASVRGPTIDLAPTSLPWYAALSLGRMFAAYLLSMLFTLVVGYAAARNHTAETIVLPILDVLQSVPILSFLPVVVLSLTAILPEGWAVELGSIILIFTSQAWNLTFSFYQSMKTVPNDLREASSIFRLDPWLRFRTMELPFAAIPLLWNSMMSWAGGWFFLMAAEIFTVGARDFRLPGLGAYLQTAASAGNVTAITWGLAALIATIVLLDQLVWRPLLAWADRFKVETVEAEFPPQSWAYDLWQRSRLAKAFYSRVRRPFQEWLDVRVSALLRTSEKVDGNGAHIGRRVLLIVFSLIGAAGLAWGAYEAVTLLLQMPSVEWVQIAFGAGASLARVIAALVIALAWTVPVGVAIGMNRRLAAVLQPIVQVVAAIPATALFPIFLLVLIRAAGGLDLAAILLMLMGTQWYLLFNIIAGAAAIPQDLIYTTATLGIRGWARWRTLILPGLFPYLITGMITATGGSWNATIVAEYVTFGGKTFQTTGLGSLIAQATAQGNYPLLLASTVTMIAVVIVLNRAFWRRLYRAAEERYRME
jgi:NitT/TauT family transport system permease protein